MRPIVLVLALAASMVPSVASADDGPHDRTWYGWQTLSVDAALIGVFASYPAWPGFEDDGVLLLFDALAFVSASPLVHKANGNDSVVGNAFGFRLAFPAVGALVGLAAGAAIPCTCAKNDLLCFCGLSNMQWGLYGGVIAGASLASIVDAVAFAWKRPEPRATSGVTWAIAPFARAGGGGLSLGGTF